MQGSSLLILCLLSLAVFAAEEAAPELSREEKQIEESQQ